jgi:GH43 family beta-xylosidase
MSRQRKDDEIVNYFTAIFSQCDDPQRMWIGEIIQTGDEKYKTWQKKVQSLSYVFRQEMENLLSDINFNSIFETENGKHPVLVKEHLRNNLSIESLIILDAIVNYKKEFDGKLNDFVWKTISLKIDKYKPFLLNSIDIDKYKTTLRGIAIQ